MQDDKPRTQSLRTPPHMLLMCCLHCDNLTQRFAYEDVCMIVRSCSALHQHLVHIYTLSHALCSLAWRPPPCCLKYTVWAAFSQPHVWAISVDSTFPCPSHSDEEEEILGSLVCDVILWKEEREICELKSYPSLVGVGPYVDSCVWPCILHNLILMYKSVCVCGQYR